VVVISLAVAGLCSILEIVHSCKLAGTVTGRCVSSKTSEVYENESDVHGIQIECETIDDSEVVSFIGSI
jgi:hypothetical protein